MGFKRSKGMLAMVLLWVLSSANVVAGQAGSSAVEITVLVNNSAGISPAVLNQAEAEAGRIFRVAGIDIVWVDCALEAAIVDDECRGVPRRNEFVLHIVPTGRTSSDLVFGVAFLAQDGAGKYSDIFYDRVERAHGEFGTPLSRLLGAVAAHELGHLLLGIHAHSYAGVMTPVWRQETLRHMEMGSLLFTRDQAFQMRVRILGGERTLVGSGASAGK
jgi:hypothetical protein